MAQEANDNYELKDSKAGGWEYEQNPEDWNTQIIDAWIEHLDEQFHDDYEEKFQNENIEGQNFKRDQLGNTQWVHSTLGLQPETAKKFADIVRQRITKYENSKNKPKVNEQHGMSKVEMIDIGRNNNNNNNNEWVQVPDPYNNNNNNNNNNPLLNNVPIRRKQNIQQQQDGALGSPLQHGQQSRSPLNNGSNSVKEQKAMKQMHALKEMISQQQTIVNNKTQQAAKMIHDKLEDVIAMLYQKQQELQTKLNEQSQQDIQTLCHCAALVQNGQNYQNDLVQSDMALNEREMKIVNITNDTIERIKQKEKVFGIPEVEAMNMDIVKKNILSMRLDINYSANDSLETLEFMQDYKDENKSKHIVRFSNKNDTKCIIIDDCAVSEKSDLFDGEDMMGIVLYQYDDENEWILNGIQCKSGFIYLCKSDKLKNISSHPIDTMHARCYNYLFGVDPDYRKIVGAGCGYKDGKWKYNSSTFCAPENRQNTLAHHYGMDDFKDDWHDDNRAMHEIEKQLLDDAITKWIKHIEECKYVTWSWWRYDWTTYDKETNEYIEREYKKYLTEQLSVRNDIYCIELNTEPFKTNLKLKNHEYKLYFSAPSISLDSQSIHSRDNPKWKNDKDKNNAYFLQKNVNLDYYRIVRRRFEPQT